MKTLEQQLSEQITDIFIDEIPSEIVFELSSSNPDEWPSILEDWCMNNILFTSSSGFVDASDLQPLTEFVFNSVDWEQVASVITVEKLKKAKNNK